MPRRARNARLTHLDARSRPTMVDVGAKAVTHRIAEAEARVRLPAAVARALRRSGHRTKKGPVFDTAIVAGVLAAKRTSELIPFCHPLALEQCRIDIGFAPGAGASVVVVRCGSSESASPSRAQTSCPLAAEAGVAPSATAVAARSQAQAGTAARP